MDHPADDVDLAVAASYAYSYVRALIAFIEQLQRTVPPGVHTAAATLVAWIWGLDPDDERLKRAPHGCWPTASGASSGWTRRWKKEVVRRLASPVYADRSPRSSANSARRWPPVCRIIGVMEPPSPTPGSGLAAPRSAAGRAAAGSGPGVVAGGPGRR